MAKNAIYLPEKSFDFRHFIACFRNFCLDYFVAYVAVVNYGGLFFKVYFGGSYSFDAEKSGFYVVYAMLTHHSFDMNGFHRIFSLFVFLFTERAQT